MKNLPAISTGFAIMLAVVSGLLWQQLRKEKEVNASLQSELADSRAMASRLDALPPRLAPAPLPATAAPATPASTAPVNANPPTRTSPSANLVEPSAENIALNLALSDGNLMKDPEFRKARLTQLRLDMRRNNPGLADEPGLSERDAEQIYDLLVDNQMRLIDLNTASNTNAAGPTPREEQARNRELLQQQRQGLQKQLEQTLATTLGPAKYAQWQQYQENRGARNQALSMSNQLTLMGLPLNNSQMKPLTTVMIAQQQRQRQETETLRATFGNQLDPQIRARLQEESIRRSTESNRRLLEAMAPVLTPQQLAVFREQYEAQEVMNRVRSRALEQAQLTRGQP